VTGDAPEEPVTTEVYVKKVVLDEVVKFTTEIELAIGMIGYPVPVIEADMTVPGSVGPE